ncbi:protein kinase [Arhodomonas aquaeolei]|uniref:protein kinase domain-containing protein n=1 Tax=Arhodomonas aquaeolei TaxID=2369 RepID=UPI002169B111|nr:protein kinase [Arhodomonas aquaeolei]MCS4503771.1 protein kinase [Arhodomonas aquaeolei]
MSRAATAESIRHFYIPEEQSVYLLSKDEAHRLKAWVRLCEEQLRGLGYRQVCLLGKGAYSFVFAGRRSEGASQVFKFSRITLAQHIQDRLEEEAYMLSQVRHPNVPAFLAFERIHGQRILVMERAPGEDLDQRSIQVGPLPVDELLHIARQLADMLAYLRHHPRGPIVHGDIKPSNLVYDPDDGRVSLIDWGSSVFAQVDHEDQPTPFCSLDAMTGGGETNARLGDVYFIGEEQLGGGLSSPRFDEQGVASTLYALASAQSCRFGSDVIPARALGLPRPFARVLDGLLSRDPDERRRAGDYFLGEMAHLGRIVAVPRPARPAMSLLPIKVAPAQDMESVVYSSRKSFLREEVAEATLAGADDAQLERYYKNFMHGMGDREKALMAAVSRLSRYPVVGGLGIRWKPEGLEIDSYLELRDPDRVSAFAAAVNVVVTLARSLEREGVFKCVMFDARHTLHLERAGEGEPFEVPPDLRIPYEVVPPESADARLHPHSYFEDGRDPDEYLALPQPIIDAIVELNDIPHTGCVIFESKPTHLKIHSYYTLLAPEREAEFAALLERIADAVDQIRGLGIAGFMKLPYKRTRHFRRRPGLGDCFYPANPRRAADPRDLTSPLFLLGESADSDAA